jgi:hypothetical protein
VTRISLAVGLLLVASVAEAEVRDAHLVIGPEQVWIEVIDPGEMLWIGRDENERTQVLSGPDIEIVAFATDAEDVALLGAKAIVAVVPASHTCEELSGIALAYYVVTVGESPVADGPLITCTELAISVAPGAIVLEADPMSEGEFWAWVPGKGFQDRLE